MKPKEGHPGVSGKSGECRICDPFSERMTMLSTNTWYLQGEIMG